METRVNFIRHLISINVIGLANLKHGHCSQLYSSQTCIWAARKVREFELYTVNLFPLYSFNLCASRITLRSVNLYIYFFNRPQINSWNTYVKWGKWKNYIFIYIPHFNSRSFYVKNRIMFQKKYLESGLSTLEFMFYSGCPFFISMLVLSFEKHESNLYNEIKR
jgi:hypothetical protein